MRCQGCGDNKGIQQNGLTLCKKCYDPSSEILRCQSEAMIQYALNKKDLEELDYAVAYNTHSGHYDTKLYLVTDLHDLAVQKWGSDDKLRRVIEERGKRRDEKKMCRCDQSSQSWVQPVTGSMKTSRFLLMSNTFSTSRPHPLQGSGSQRWASHPSSIATLRFPTFV